MGGFKGVSPFAPPPPPPGPSTSSGFTGRPSPAEQQEVLEQGPEVRQAPAPQQEQGSEGNCPSGQVWRTDSQGAYGSGRPGCEPEDWRSKQDKDTCLGARPNCGPDYDAWCDFSTATWKCGYIGKPQRPGEGDIRKDPRAGLQYNLRQGHATMVPGRSDLAYNVGTGNPSDSSTWSECWKVPDGTLVPCPKGLQAAAGGGGGGRGGFGYSGGGFPATPYEQALAAQLGSLSDEFSKFASNVFGVSFPAYQKGVDYYSTLLGRGGRGAMQAATAPAAEQIAAGTEGTLKAIGSGYISGGAKEQAEIQARLQGEGDIARLTQGVQPGAASALIEAGTAGMSQGQAATGSAAQVLSGLADLSVSSRLSGEGMELQRDLGFAGLAMEGQKLDLQRDLGFAGLDLSYAQLAESSSQFRQQLGAQMSMFGQQMGWEQQKFKQGMQFDREGRLIQSSQFALARKDQKQAMKNQMIGSIGAEIAGTGAKALFASAAKFKVDIRPAVEPTEALRRIADEAAPALRGWRYREVVPGSPALRRRAYDNALVLDLLPTDRYGVLAADDAPAGQYLDVPALLGDLIGAVRALRDENRGLRERLERIPGAPGPAAGSGERG